MCHVNFSSSSTWYNSWVSAQSLDAVDTVINSSLKIIEQLSCGTSQNDGGHFVFFFISSENNAFL